MLYLCYHNYHIEPMRPYCHWCHQVQPDKCTHNHHLLLNFCDNFMISSCQMIRELVSKRNMWQVDNAVVGLVANNKPRGFKHICTFSTYTGYVAYFIYAMSYFWIKLHMIKRTQPYDNMWFFAWTTKCQWWKLVCIKLFWTSFCAMSEYYWTWHYPYA